MFEKLRNVVFAGALSLAPTQPTRANEGVSLPQEDSSKLEQTQKNSMLLAEENFKKRLSNLTLDDIPNILLNDDYDSSQLLLQMRDVTNSDAAPVPDEWKLGFTSLAKSHSPETVLQALNFIKDQIVKKNTADATRNQTFNYGIKYSLLTKSGSYSGFVALEALCKTTPEQKEGLKKIISDLRAQGYEKALEIRQFHPTYLAFFEKKGEVQAFIALQSHSQYRSWLRSLLKDNTFPLLYAQPPSVSLAQLEKWSRDTTAPQ